MLMLSVVLILLAVGAVFSQCSTNITVGQIYLNIDSRLPTYIVSHAYEPTNGISVLQSTLSLGYNHRVYFTNQCVYNYNPLLYRPFFVLGQTFQYTVDVSNVSCGCNAALYLVSMPAFDQNQNPTPTQCGDYSCDAKRVCGSFCPEMDLIEANRAAMAVTPHKCSSQGKYYPWCDGGGCSQNTKNFHGVYGPSSAYKINTMKPFQVAHKFQRDTPGGRLTQITTTLSQNGNTFTMVHDSNNCGKDYIASMSDIFSRGMVIVSSYRSGNDGNAMTRLDVPPCDPNVPCDKSGIVHFSDISLQY